MIGYGNGLRARVSIARCIGGRPGNGGRTYGIGCVGSESIASMAADHRVAAIILSKRRADLENGTAASLVRILTNIGRAGDERFLVIRYRYFLRAIARIAGCVGRGPGDGGSAKRIRCAKRVAIASGACYRCTGAIIGGRWHAGITRAALSLAIIQILIGIASDHRLLGIIYSYLEGATGQRIAISIFQRKCYSCHAGWEQRTAGRT